MAPSTVATGLAVLLLAAVAVAAWRVRWASRPLPGLIAGALVGALIPASWYVTGVLGFDEFEPVPLESLTFTAPLGDALQYLMTYTGASADFGIAAVAGVLAGSFLVAAATRSLRAEGFEGAGHLGRYLLGGALMGFGGVLALGCTVGAGLSGVSTLSLGSLLAFAAIGTGATVTHRLMGASRAPASSPALAAAPSR